jgi:hypothetical protein
MNNDFLGETDKLLTGAMQLGLLRRYSDSAYSLQLHWRFLTPVYKRTFGESDLKIPIGRFADWAEMTHGYSRRFGGNDRLVHSFSLGVGHVGNKGAKGIHTYIHQLTKNPIHQLEYNDQLEGYTPSGGYQLGYELPELNLNRVTTRQQLSIGHHYKNIMWETYGKANIVVPIIDGFRFGAETTLVAQHLSHTYDSPRPLRGEIAGGLLIWHYFQTNVKWVSVYLYDDAYGQVFFEPITFNILF